jgi:hypothetical protein
MEDIDQVFRATLKYFQAKYKNQRQFAFALGVNPVYLFKLMKDEGPGKASEEFKRKVAIALGYPGRQFEDFLDIGRAILAGKDPEAMEEDWSGLTGDDLRERGFITVPFSNDMKLAAGTGGTIPVTDDATTSNIVVHAPSIGRRTSRNLQAFRVGGDSMEPVIAEGGIVLADTSENEIQRLKEGRIYVLCWDMQEGECAVKYLNWGEKGKTVIISSPDIKLYPPISRRLSEIQLVGRVIWSWREH